MSPIPVTRSCRSPFQLLGYVTMLGKAEEIAGMILEQCERHDPGDFGAREMTDLRGLVNEEDRDTRTKRRRPLVDCFLVRRTSSLRGTSVVDNFPAMFT